MFTAINLHLVCGFPSLPCLFKTTTGYIPIISRLLSHLQLVIFSYKPPFCWISLYMFTMFHGFSHAFPINPPMFGGFHRTERRWGDECQLDGSLLRHGASCHARCGDGHVMNGDWMTGVQWDFMFFFGGGLLIRCCLRQGNHPFKRWMKRKNMWFLTNGDFIEENSFFWLDENNTLR
jgi:hypothetical protein